MLGEGVQEVQKKVFSVWCCYLMIAAMFFWGGSFVSGENQLDFDINGVDLEFTSEGFSDNEMTAVTEGDEGAQTLTITIGDGDDKREYKISNIKDLSLIHISEPRDTA